MKNVIVEYGSFILSLVAVFGFFTAIGQLFFRDNGFFAVMITAVLGGTV